MRNECVASSALERVLSREIRAVRSAPSLSILTPSYRSLLRKAYKRASGNGRKVFKTKVTGEVDCNPVYDVAYSPLSYPGYKLIAVGDELGFLSVVQVPIATGRRAAKNGVLEHRSDPDNDTRHLGVARSFGCHDTEGHQERGEPPPVQPVVYTLAWSSDGAKILSGYGDGSIRLWDLEKSSSGKSASLIHCSEKSLKRVAWLQQQTFISCSRTNEVYVHDERMRNPLANRIDCNQINAKLTDVCVLSDTYVATSASNQSALHLFDIRKTYKLYKRITPVESFELRSPGYATLRTDVTRDGGILYALGSDSVVRCVDYRRSNRSLPSYRVPESVDFFTKIDVDEYQGVLLSGSCGDSAWGFDLTTTPSQPSDDSSEMVKPFFRLRGNGSELTNSNDDELIEEDDDKENVNREQDNSTTPSTTPNESGSMVTGSSRSCCAVTLGNSVNDFIQMACGGDTSTITEYTL